MNYPVRSTCHSHLRAGETPAVPLKIYLLFLFAVAALAAAIAGAESARTKHWARASEAASSISSREDRIDRDLSIAAASALGNREGTIIMMDPTNGRIRAVVNPHVAFETAFTPGSTIKPFTTLDALRSGTIEKDSRMLCRENFSHEGFTTVCSHPRNLPPFKPAEAIAYSCNYYFGKLGEQLQESTFNSTLEEFGFGQPTKVTQVGVHEAAGKLPRGQLRAETALGEGDQIQVTPIQLLTAYSALINGGHLLVPQIAPEAGFLAKQQRNLSISDEHTRLILSGMRGVVRYGTAEQAKLHSLPLYVFGKTGTATPIGGFRTQGWFVGFASQIEEAPTAPENIRLAVLVFLKRAHGADAAEVSRTIFEAYLPCEERDSETNGKKDGETSQIGSLRFQSLAGQEGRFTPAGVGTAVGGGKPPFPTCEFKKPETFREAANRLAVSRSTIRVHLVRENSTRAVSLENYVLGVVAAEGSTEMEVEALKALAIASRTYAVKNIRRHTDDGYDFCTTTHCQRYLPIDSDAGKRQISKAISQAVKETAGQVLHDKDGRIVDSYFSASCGGATANIGTLWGVKPPSYLMGASDEFCLTMPHHAWKDVISSANLLRAIESDPRTSVGGRLTSVTVSSRDASGRAELITIDGARRRSVRGWDFKIVVGRQLGWHLLKSSRFEISRSRSNYVFHGTGFGHGLGLCQEGAHVMARRGAGYQQILTKYFPGTRVSPELTGMGSLKVKYFAGREGWFTPADSHCHTSWGKPPFLTCKFKEPERSGKSARRHRRNNQLTSHFPNHAVISHHSAMPHPFVLPLSSIRSNHTVAASPHLPVTASLRHSNSASSRLRVASNRRTLSSEHFRLNYPARFRQGDLEYVLKVLETGRANLIRRVSTANVSFQLPTLELFINETTGDFVGRTGQPPWVAAATLGKRIELQPLDLLARRRILEMTLRHELVHAIVDAIGHGRTPRWLAEGLALHFSGEGQLVLRDQDIADIEISELEERLVRPASAAAMRAAYAAAYREVKRLVKANGESAVWLQASQSKI